MYAIDVRDDDKKTLVWQETPDPVPKHSEVLVDVFATAVNRADLLQRRGGYAPPAGASPILGLECAGVVSAVGEGVDPALVGRRVAALLSGGGYAERAVVPADHLLEIPESMPFTEAAAIPEVFYTAFLNLCIEAELREGETVMIHAAASGVGTAALQICRELGCPTIATASGAKLAALTALGAGCVVDRHLQSFSDVAKSFTAGHGVDVILDPVAASYLADNVALLAPRGRLVIIGLLGGVRAELDLAALLRRRLRVIGSVLRSRSDAEKTEITRQFRTRVWPWIEEGRVVPVIHQSLPIEQANEAHSILLRNETTGKIVLTVRT